MKLFLATSNKGKIGEICELLKGVNISVVTPGDIPPFDFPPEDGATFSENAVAKAVFAGKMTGLISLADDSGLEVDALGGRPGVRSARYAGPCATDRDNFEKLINELDGVPAGERTARFRCVIAIVGTYEDQEICETFDGTLEGVIAKTVSGSGGFGYDPVFFLPERGLTTAELSREAKNAISHRGEALHKACSWLEEFLR